MAPANRNVNFRLGLERKQLVEAAGLFGKGERAAKKASTVTLERFVTRQLAGEGVKVPTLTDTQRAEIKGSAKSFGIYDALHMVGYRIQKATGAHSEQNYLRLSIARAFNAYYDRGVTSAHIDELVSRIAVGSKSYDEMISGISDQIPFYEEIFAKYAEELEAQDQQRQQQQQQGV